MNHASREQLTTTSASYMFASPSAAPWQPVGTQEEITITVEPLTETISPAAIRLIVIICVYVLVLLAFLEWTQEYEKVASDLAVALAFTTIAATLVKRVWPQSGNDPES